NFIYNLLEKIQYRWCSNRDARWLIIFLNTGCYESKRLFTYCRRGNLCRRSIVSADKSCYYFRSLRIPGWIYRYAPVQGDRCKTICGSKSESQYRLSGKSAINGLYEQRRWLN